MFFGTYDNLFKKFLTKKSSSFVQQYIILKAVSITLIYNCSEVDIHTCTCTRLLAYIYIYDFRIEDDFWTEHIYVQGVYLKTLCMNIGNYDYKEHVYCTHAVSTVMPHTAFQVYRMHLILKYYVGRYNILYS